MWKEYDLYTLLGTQTSKLVELLSKYMSYWMKYPIRHVLLVKNGILGGGIVADSEAITYHTGKLTIPKEYRHLILKYEDICEVTKGWIFILPTVTVKMRNGKEYKFAVFFSRKRFVNTLISMGVDT